MTVVYKIPLYLQQCVNITDNIGKNVKKLDSSHYCVKITIEQLCQQRKKTLRIPLDKAHKQN